jgi:hypothetical protein
VVTTRGHKEQCEQFKRWCKEHGLTYKQLPSFTRDCDTANGEHGEELAGTVWGWYRPERDHKGDSQNRRVRPRRTFPCQRHEGQRCPYAAKRDFEPDEYDVLIGHYAHAHREDKVVNGRAVVFDEFPDAYETVLGPELSGGGVVLAGEYRRDPI